MPFTGILGGMTNERSQPNKLYRSRNDKMLAGVCAGIAEHFGLDVSLVRVGWVLLSLFTAGFPGVLGYIVLAVVIPERPE